MPFGAGKVALLGAAGSGGCSYDPAYTWIADIITTDSTTQTVSFTSIPQTYHALHLVGNCNATGSDYSLFRLSSSAQLYYGSGYELGATSTSTGPMHANWTSASSTNYAYFGGYGTSTSMLNQIGGNYMEMWIPGYSNTDEPKTMWAKWYAPASNAWYGNIASEILCRMETSSAVDQIDLLTSGNNWYIDSMWTLYGVGAAS